MRLALAQCASPAGEEAAAFDAVEGALRTAAAAGADMVVMPELFLPGYNSDQIAAQAQPGDGAWGARLCSMARAAGCGLTIGFAERDGARIFNAAVTIGADGKVLAHYRKIQLYGAREAGLFTPGDGYAIFDLAGYRTAILICYDVEFAGHIRELALRGVQLILVPTANMEPYTYVMDAIVPAMAVTHGVAIAYANLCGTEGDLAYCGGSLVVGQDGVMLGQAGKDMALLCVDLAPPKAPAALATHLGDYRKIATTGPS
ncbi:MAG: nitrilase-related carbon-nitrogen hydrolase [Albidovulum sp.]